MGYIASRYYFGKATVFALAATVPWGHNER